MRRASICVAVFGLALLASSGVASALPTVTIKAKAIPIPGFPHTGNIFGAGAAVEAEVRITGNEYGGYPPPLMGLKGYLPQGAELHPKGFPTCPLQAIEEEEPGKCPKGSSAGPVGHAEGFVVFGTERVPETVSLESFYSSAGGGGLNTIIVGHTPASIEKFATGSYFNLKGGGGFGPGAMFHVPLIATVPGAPFASTERIVGKLGSAIRKNGKTLYYGTMPKKCPKHHLTVKAELTFAENGNEATPETVKVSYNAPCPRK
jgi:hypothetical protein